MLHLGLQRLLFPDGLIPLFLNALELLDLLVFKQIVSQYFLQSLGEVSEPLDLGGLIRDNRLRFGARRLGQLQKGLLFQQRPEVGRLIRDGGHSGVRCRLICRQHRRSVLVLLHLVTSRVCPRHPLYKRRPGKRDEANHHNP